MHELRSFPRYGEVYDVGLDPVVGSETGKTRPALIVSNDANNEFSDTVTVLPFTSQSVQRIYPFEFLVPEGIAGLTATSRGKANQIRTVDKARLRRLRGQLPRSFFPDVQRAIKHHLNLE